MQISHYLEGISLQRSNSLYSDVCFRGKHTHWRCTACPERSPVEKNASVFWSRPWGEKTLWRNWTLWWFNFSKNLTSSLLLQFAAESCCDIKAEGGAAERDMTAACPFTLLYSISSSAVCAFNLFHPLSHAAWTERRKHKCHINKDRRRISTLGKQGAKVGRGGGGRKKNYNLVWKIVWLRCYLRFVFARRLSVGFGAGDNPPSAGRW